MKFFAHIFRAKFIALLVFSPFLVLAASPKAPSNLRTCDKLNPAGTDSAPFFGWYVNDADNNEIQSAYQVLVASNLQNLNLDKGDVWDSGKFASRMQNYISYSGKSLSPATRYFWKVRTWDKNGNVSPYSAVASFGTGLFGSSDWSGAKWIKRNSADQDDYTNYRKTAALLQSGIKRAVAYVSACHEYELYVGGKLAGKGASFHYPQYAYYQAHDITSLLKPGAKNTFAALTHWYGGGQGRAPGSRGFLVKIVIEHTNGTKTIIGTDNTWKQQQSESFVTGQARRGGEGIGYIEKIDSRKLSAWTSPAFDDSSWQSATEIGAPPVAPWTGELQTDLTRSIEKELKPLSVKNLGKGKYMIDLGKIYAGIPKITFTGGSPGTEVAIHGGYVLSNDSTINTRGNQSTNLDYFFVLNGKTAVFKPLIYLAYRYLLVENSPNVLTEANVSFIRRNYELDPSRAGFNSSNTMLNQVWEMMIHSLVGGAQEDFLDTPTREKGAFLGDAGYQGPPSMSTMGDRALNLRVLLEFLDSQEQYWPDGRLNAVYPNVDGKRDIPDYTQAYLVWIWDYYMQTGNLSFLKANYEKLKKIGAYVEAYKNKSTGLIDRLAGGSGGYTYGIIDWPESMRYGYDMSAYSRTVIDVYAYIDFDILSRIAGVIGNTADRESFAVKAQAMKEAINKQLINANGVYIDGLKADGTQSTHVSQHANMFPMAAGIVPDQYKNTVIQSIKDRKMSAGMVSVRMLPEALGLADEGAHLLELYTNTTWDGWARTISLGGTFTWEDWSSNTSGNSMSHPWGAIGLLGIQNYVLGLKVLSPQHELIQVKPLEFNGKLKQASGIFPTDKGTIELGWERTATRFTLSLVIPVNSSAARVYLPKSGTSGNVLIVDGKEVSGKEEGNYVFVENIGSGTHTFERLAKD